MLSEELKSFLIAAIFEDSIDLNTNELEVYSSEFVSKVEALEKQIEQMKCCEWIKCRDRLPLFSGEYLAVNSHNQVNIYHYSEVDEEFLHDYDYKIVSHWMPLPEPPKAE